MNILVINAGSSSLKYQLFDMTTKTAMAKGVCERIGLDGRIKHTAGDRDPFVADKPFPDHAAAIRAVVEALTGPETGVIRSMDDIAAVGHRVVHGGEAFSGSVLIDGHVISAIEACVPLAPLHNPANLTGIRACAGIMPGVPQTAVFDTAFHQTMPPEAFLYALPYSLYEQQKIRRYGFHGTSHRYVAARAAELLGHADGHGRIVTCHLGNGSSICAVKDGQSIDTSMGFTPLAGLPMGTRAGSIDPGIMLYLEQEMGMTADKVNALLNKESGVLGLSGVSSDFRDLEAACAEGNVRAELALQIFSRSVKKHIGSYIAAMNGIDALVFTAGVGENTPRVRQLAAGELDALGLILDIEKNSRTRTEAEISAPHSPAKIYVIPTNEELVIALDTEEMVTTR